MIWHEMLWWVPTASVVLMTALGIAAATRRKGRWLLAVAAIGLVAIGASAWAQLAGRMALDGAAAARLQALQARVHTLESRLDAVKIAARQRAIAPEVAATLAADLRRFGSRRVVVSCVPDDIEAYDYANQLVNVLRQAGWDATGPEKTAILGTAAAMGVRLFVKGGGAVAPDAAKILIDAFTRFNIPFESGVTPSEAIPDPATTELFVSHKP